MVTNSLAISRWASLLKLTIILPTVREMLSTSALNSRFSSLTARAVLRTSMRSSLMEVGCSVLSPTTPARGRPQEDDGMGVIESTRSPRAVLMSKMTGPKLLNPLTHPVFFALHRVHAFAPDFLIASRVQIHFSWYLAHNAHLSSSSMNCGRSFELPLGSTFFFAPA